MVRVEDVKRLRRPRLALHDVVDKEHLASGSAYSISQDPLSNKHLQESILLTLALYVGR